MAPTARSGNLLVRSRLDEISSSLHSLKRAQQDAKLTMSALTKHIMQVDKLIDEHQWKLDTLVFELDNNGQQQDQGFQPPDLTRTAASLSFTPAHTQPQTLMNVDPTTGLITETPEPIDFPFEIQGSSDKSKPTSIASVSTKLPTNQGPMRREIVAAGTARQLQIRAVRKKQQQQQQHCRICAQSFATRDQLISHMLKQHRRQCPKCKVYFSNRLDFTKHMEGGNNCLQSTTQSQNASSYSYPCTQCSRVFRSLPGLERHAAHHKQPRTVPITSTQSSPNTNQPTNTAKTNKKKLICKYCGQQFLFESQLRTHQRNPSLRSRLCMEAEKKEKQTTNMSSYKFFCKWCNAGFRCASHLRYHYATDKVRSRLCREREADAKRHSVSLGLTEEQTENTTVIKSEALLNEDSLDNNVPMIGGLDAETNGVQQQTMDTSVVAIKLENTDD